VRTARVDDAPALARLQVASWHAAYRELIPASRLAGFTVERRTAAWRRNLAGGPGRTRLVERDGQVLGLCTLGTSRDGTRTGEIWSLYVDPEAWGSVVGSALMADALALLAARGHRQVVLWVLEGNQRAIGFYEGSGFARDGGHMIDDGLPQVRMRRELVARR